VRLKKDRCFRSGYAQAGTNFDESPRSPPHRREKRIGRTLTADCSLASLYRERGFGKRRGTAMQALAYGSSRREALEDSPQPVTQAPTDAIVRHWRRAATRRSSSSQAGSRAEAR
jgi:hypothetical protein